MQPFSADVPETVPETKCKGSGEMSKHLPIADDGTAICPICNTAHPAEAVGDETLICEHLAPQPATPA